MTFLESTNPVVTVSGSDPVVSTGGPTPVISIEEATTSQKGAVQLEDSYTSTSVIKAATPKSVKDVYDYATTLSSTLQDNIDSKSGTLLELSDTPNAYDVNKYLRSTVDGTEWATVSGGTGTSNHSELTELDYASAGHTGFSPISHSHTESDISDLDKYTQSEVNTISGTLQTEIDAIPTSLIDLADTPTTYSGSVGEYLKVTVSGIEFFESITLDRVVYVAKNGNDATETGNINAPFLTIQGAIDYVIEKYPSISDAYEQVFVLVAPGEYVEQIHSIDGIHIAGIHFPANRYSRGVRLINDGTDESNYPIRSTINDKYRIYGINIETTDGVGILGKLPIAGIFESCFFLGQWIESDLDSNHFVLFEDCDLRDNNNLCFNLTGINLLGRRVISLRHSTALRSTPVFSSTHVSKASLGINDGSVLTSSSLRLEGDWSLRAIDSNIANGRYGIEGRSYIGGTGDVIIIDCLANSGFYFTENPNSVKINNVNFDDGHTTIPADEADIIADVDITNVEYSGNNQYNGIDGRIKIINPRKHVGTGVIDTYKNINEALVSASTGETVQVYPGTYNENIVITDEINVHGISKEDTILTSTSGTLLVNNSSGSSYIRNFTFITSTSGTNNTHLLNSTAGTVEFVDCDLYVSLIDTHTEAIIMTDSNLILNGTDTTYTQTGNTVGSGIVHRMVYLDGESSMGWINNSTASMVINDNNALADATLCESSTTSNIEISMKSSSSSLLSQNPLWGGDAYAMKIVGTLAGPVSTSELTVSVIGAGGAGTGYVFYVDTTNNNGTVYGTLNVLTAAGFAKNYVGCVEGGDTFNSHFDMLNAVDLICGAGNVNYVTSPGAGNLMISGSYINMYDNDLIVAKRGGEFTSLKTAIESITDNSRTNRYNIHVHSGFYIEDNPIELKPYVYISGQFKHNPRILPANPLEHLFTVPTGYCTCDIGELTLQAPAGDSSHQVYIVYAGPGSKPIMGVYQNLFLGDNINYCNGFRCEEPLSGYHTVNCMAYGSFNKFAHMSGGNWTDSGSIPEASTAVKHYLYMDGEGISIIDLMRAKCPNIEKMFYINHANAELIVSDIYAEDQRTLITGPNGGKIRMRGSTFHGKNEFDAGDITIHGGTFEDNAYIEALTGNLDFLSVTSTKNKNESTYCVKVIGGGNTEIYLGGGNIFDSPDGVQSIQLSGAFSKVQVEGVRQHDVAMLLDGESETLTHLPDLDYSRIVQVQAFPGTPSIDSIECLTADESNYIQEDHTKTDFIGDKITLSGIGLVAYAHWHMNETAGKDVYDGSGFNRDGLGNKTDDADWIAGKLNNCLKFDADDEYVAFGNIASWERTDTFSIDCWFYTTTDTQMYVISKMEDATDKGYGFYLNARKPYFVLGNNSTTNKIEVYSNTAVSSGAWHHGVFTYDGSSTASGINIYIDGVNKPITVISDNLSSTTANAVDFQMSGREGADNFTFNYGQIDEVVLYEKVLSQTEVDYRYNSGAGTETLESTYNTDKGWYVTTSSGSSFDSSSWSNIAQVVFTETIPQYTQIKYLISADEMNSWTYWDGSLWGITTLSGIETYGNSSDVLENLSITDWNGLFLTSSGIFDVAANLKTTHSGLAPSLDKMEVVYSTPGPRRKISGNEIIIEYSGETTTRLTNNSGNTFTGIKCNILKLNPY